MAPTVVVGITAGIAAYKGAFLVRRFQRAGYDVRVVPTPASLQFVGSATWEGLTGRPAPTGVFDATGADHVELARIADLVVVAPATADFMARLRAGMADDLLTTTILASRCPVLLAPAMHTQMWLSPATRDNVAVLRARGMTVLDPDSGPLGSGDSGVGRLPDPERIADRAIRLLDDAPAADLAGRTVLISAGGTHEPIDPVRFIGNSSSGRQGVALAAAASSRGAHVVLIESNVGADVLSALPPGVEVVAAPRAADVEREVLSRLASCDAVVMAAAVADFRPASVAPEKIKKDPSSTDAPTIVLERTVDVLAAITNGEDRPAVVMGFAAETGTDEQVLDRGIAKARRKGADLLAINRVGPGVGFGDVPTEVVVVDADGRRAARLTGSKDEVAEGLMALIADRLATMAR
ncbi:bifunctional phosphopantothenoylcysteine decarboxylase/phosphopantothenate--cysteine ligase CoaBC [Actinomyces sp. B33]|uniref:bifunctional phosphopantothenoylcysteine decarboxylase/phosphopantothenate--cysteine ligase CoaBC n=1 Tax=Actinomyces sp. B33 TaxID=2942131 RepID=UPI002341C720|nr:bifunctional phosphopantothenoylcysteine decarboxylase/phosphopantothenate--cysteine ligase CoaBC [Actinomyces sp. B33]MDC4233324.1 bifunctional phosphopantothenoylcysteine decarboxylase/phosphopantothenate--cysteine ligase CoaBC [Actinomyces sp. B33]